MKYIVTVNGKAIPVEVERRDGAFEVLVDGSRHEVDLAAEPAGWLYSLIVDGRSYQLAVDNGSVSIAGQDYQTEVIRDVGQGAGRRAGQAEGPARLRAPIPGLVVRIDVVVGDRVTAGQTVLILEAMKMQMEIKAPRDGQVSEILVQPKQEAGQSQVLLVIGD